MLEKPVLGIETSCDETSASIILKDEVLSNVIYSQIDIHAVYGGVVPEIASREHIRSIIPVVKTALKEANMKIEDLGGIAVTYGPGLVGSLLVGLQFAKAVSLVNNLPFIGVNHLEGHLWSPFVKFKGEEVYQENFSLPFIALLVSGGHTCLYRVDDIGKYKFIGGTRDDAAGEAYDKVAKVLGLGYPGGPVIDKLAKQGNPDAINFPQGIKRHDSFDFSFSGIKTAVATYVKKQNNLSSEHINDICASFQKSVIDILIKKSLMALQKEGLENFVITGGVSANKGLRDRAKEISGINLLLPSLKACTDNAAMIAYVGNHYLSTGKRDDMTLNSISNLPLKTL